MLEKHFENVLQRYPELIEEGLKFSGRQVNVGGKFVDLLFEDRHGQKLIVELKQGIVKREHVAQLLDYEGYFLTDDNPNIRVMLIGNRVPPNLRNSLDHHGFEWKEISVSELITYLKNKNDDHLLAQFDEEAQTTSATVTVQSKRSKCSNELNDSAITSYRLFKDQKNLFIEGLSRIDPNIKFKNWNELSEMNIQNRKNWFIGFAPPKWGVFKGGWFGIHFGFIYYRDKKTNTDYVRFPVGVEKPLKSEYHRQFKDDVVALLKQKEVYFANCSVWPEVGFGGAKLIEPTPIVLNEETYKKILNVYLSLDNFINTVEVVIKQYYEKGCFDVDLNFHC